MCTFDNITGHKKLPDNDWGVTVLWGTVEETWQHMYTIKEDEKLTISTYARHNNLLNMPNYQW